MLVSVPLGLRGGQEATVWKVWMEFSHTGWGVSRFVREAHQGVGESQLEKDKCSCS